jgi:hypothetical protein
MAGAPLKFNGKTPQFFRDERIVAVVSRAPAMLGLAEQILLGGHVRISLGLAQFLFVLQGVSGESTRCPTAGSCGFSYGVTIRYRNADNPLSPCENFAPSRQISAGKIASCGMEA